MTRQDHIDPLVSKIVKCGSPGCGPSSIQVVFTRPAGYIVDFEPVWVCSSGHCSDYDDIPSLRKPEDCPLTWIQHNAEQVLREIKVELCAAHKSKCPYEWPYADPNGHLHRYGGSLKLCLPKMENN